MVENIIINCKRCGKELTNPQSIKRGYGPICWGKLQARASAQGTTMDEFIEEYEREKE